MSLRQDASVTPCELCKVTKYTGGAMKQAHGLGPDGEKLWVHVSCSLWIPEVRGGNNVVLCWFVLGFRFFLPSFRSR